MYVPAAGTGTVSNPDGTFSLSLKQTADGTPVTFSCIGFTDRTLTLGELRGGEACPVVLAEAKYELSAAEVSAEELRLRRDRTLGNPDGNTGSYAQFRVSEGSDRGMEVGNLMRVKGDWRLKQIGVHIPSVSHDTMQYEVNVRRGDTGTPGEILNRQRIFLTVDSSLKDEPFVLDLADLDISGNGDFFVCIEALDSAKDGYWTMFSVKMSKGLTYFKQSDGVWSNAPVKQSIGLWCEVRSER